MFNKVVLSETGSDVSIALETDNHAFRAVPEPLTILGSGLALGFGAIFKKQQSRRRQ
ncbi:MAG: PEP-CTERM sorting domain-containing protein [Coleofasciculus sp. G1-WW12-02]|uniref:PEP-CTERM sorting domain-containing protein n=1 Tax=unclassified Coleofasciculus TaxID=2692782 RepID=UPI0032FD7196